MTMWVNYSIENRRCAVGPRGRPRHQHHDRRQDAPRSDRARPTPRRGARPACATESAACRAGRATSRRGRRRGSIWRASPGSRSRSRSASRRTARPSARRDSGSTRCRSRTPRRSAATRRSNVCARFRRRFRRPAPSTPFTLEKAGIRRRPDVLRGRRRVSYNVYAGTLASLATGVYDHAADPGLCGITDAIARRWHGSGHRARFRDSGKLVSARRGRECRRRVAVWHRNGRFDPDRLRHMPVTGMHASPTRLPGRKP